MAAEIILLILLILLLLLIAIFSLNINIVISFYTYADAENINNTLLEYAASVRISSFEVFRKTNHSPKKKKKKKDLGSKIFYNLREYVQWLELHNLSAVGSVAFGDAASTALASGILNGITGSAAALLGIFLSEIHISRIDIRPDYSDSIRLNFFFECILKCNAGNIILTTLNILKGSSKNVKSYK